MSVSVGPNRLISRVGLIGGGVIGGGWAARFALHNIPVTIYDPDPEAERKVSEVVSNARRAWADMLPQRDVAEAPISFATSLEAAVADADFVQENLPEQEHLKVQVLAEASRHAKGDAVFASSTSGLLPTRLQSEMKGPERLVVGHPFNPVYLLPLVEIVGGERTSEDTRDIAKALYAAIGMQPLIVRNEIEGFISDRLQEALWREALHLVNDGVATAAEIDDAVRYGPGLRWSFMGTMLTFRLAGGEDGMTHFLKQFGPALQLPWTKLEAPALTDDLVERLAAQSDDQADGQSIRELERLRDDCLVSVIQALARHDYAAGALLNRQAAGK